jgi:hypothetical protein
MESENLEPPSKRFRLNAKMCSIAAASGDALVRNVPKVLEAFEFSEVTGQRYFWKYLPDDAFGLICNRPGVSVRTMNRTLWSHLLRVIEAFEMVSIWRARDLVESCVASLNGDRLISAATLGRSLIELAATYGDAANFLRANLENFPWSQMGEYLLTPELRDENGGPVSMESFIERLMSGTRIKDFLEGTPNMQQRSIITTLEKLDKGLIRQNLWV